jgi:hypothetical protein
MVRKTWHKRNLDLFIAVIYMQNGLCKSPEARGKGCDVCILVRDSRNAKIFRNEVHTPSQTISAVIQELALWLVRFVHNDQKVAANSWRDHFSACNSVI